MKDEEAQTSTTTTTTTSAAAAAAAAKKKGSLLKSLGRDGGKYKFWVLAAILLLAFWSMFTGSVTLKWSSTGTLLNTLSGDFDSRINNDLDILEVEEREKLVKHMWDVYTQSKSIQLPKFWQVAFKAAYMNLISEVSTVRDAAFYEIAKMSFHRPALLKQLAPSESSTHLHSTSTSTSTSIRTSKEAKLPKEPMKTTTTRFQ